MSKSMKRAACALCMLSAAALLAACGNGNDSGGYVDIQSYIDSTEPEPENLLNVIAENFQSDNNPYNIMKLGYTMDDGFLYVNARSIVKIDLHSGEVKSFCQIPGCAHTYNSPGCMNMREMGSFKASKDGIYFIDGNKVMLTDGASEEVVLENRFATDYEKRDYERAYEITGVWPEKIYGLSRLIFDGDLMYVCGSSYFFTYNTVTHERTEPVAIAESVIYSMAVSGGNVYYSTDNAEFFFYDGSTGEIQKIADNVWQVSTWDGRVYYNIRENNVPVLYSADLSCGDVRKMVENCYVNSYVDGSGIYYQQDYLSDDTSLWVCSLDGSDVRKIEFPAGEDSKEPCEFDGSIYIISDSFLDHVFIFDLSTDSKAFALKKGTDEIKEIQLDGSFNYDSY